MHRRKLKTMKDWEREANGNCQYSWYDYAKPGDLVDESVFIYFMDVTTPRVYRDGYLQVGAPYSRVMDDEMGTERDTFPTFERVEKAYTGSVEIALQEKQNILNNRRTKRMSINSIRLSAYGFRMEAVGSKKFIKRERDAFLEFAAGRVNETAQKLAEAVCAEPLHPFCNCAMPGVDSDQEREKPKDTGKELNITHKYKKTFTLDELRALIRNGEIQNHVSVGDTIWIMFDGKEVPYDVIGFDVEELADKTLDHSMTIQAHVAIEAREFDTKGDYGSNVWADSELREYLQSDEFKERFTDLIPYLAKVKKNNSNGEQTEDLFFLLSKEEFDPEETPYEFYENKANRVKFTEDGNTCRHWTRSASRGNSSNAWYVTSDGYVGNSTAYWARRCAPACTIA